MDTHGGPYDRDPYGRGTSEQEGTDSGYEGNPYGQQPGYGQQSPYDPAGAYGSPSYGQQGYGDGGYDGGNPYVPGNTGRTNRAGYGQDYDQREYAQGGNPYDLGDTGRTDRPGYDRREYEAEPGYNPGDTGRTRMGGYDEDAYGRQTNPYDGGNTGRTGRVNRAGYDSGYESGDYAQQRTPYDGGDTGRTGRIPRDGGARGGYGAESYAGVYERGSTGRTRRPEYDPGASRYGQEPQEDEYEEERRPRRKKKRNKFVRFFRGLAAYIAQLPAKTLIIFGGSVAVVLVAIILLAVLLPKSGTEQTPEGNGQLTLTDITPTPSLPPTAEPLITPEASTPTPILDPLSGVKIKTVGDTNDAIPAVQERLVELGYMTMPEGGYTTKFGTATKKAVRIFQVKNFDDPDQWDGILGSGTYMLLMSQEAKAFYLSKGDGGTATKELTDLVAAVKTLQERLIALKYMTGTATGVYGSGTATAVKLFQSYNGLVADGVAGPSTLSLIYTGEALDAVTGQANPKPTPAAGTTGDAAASGTGAADTGDTDTGDTGAAPTGTDTGTTGDTGGTGSN